MLRYLYKQGSKVRQSHLCQFLPSFPAAVTTSTSHPEITQPERTSLEHPPTSTPPSFVKTCETKRFLYRYWIICPDDTPVSHPSAGIASCNGSTVKEARIANFEPLAPRLFTSLLPLHDVNHLRSITRWPSNKPRLSSSFLSVMAVPERYVFNSIAAVSGLITSFAIPVSCLCFP